MSDIEKDLERIFLKKSLLMEKKEGCNDNIRELGFLPTENFQKYSNFKIDRLLKHLHKINERLKNYSHINKRAFDQYVAFTRQRNKLISRKQDLDKSGESIRELIASLDHRKNEAIQRTFDNVAENFAQIFESLVPSGHGKLIMKSNVRKYSIAIRQIKKQIFYYYSYNKMSIWMVIPVLLIVSVVSRSM